MRRLLAHVACLALAVAAAVWVSANQAAWAQEESDKGWTSVYMQQVKAGPYDVTIHYTRWPLRAKTNQRFVIEVAGGIQGKSGRGNWFRQSDLTSGSWNLRRLQTYPGIEDAWVVDVAGMVDPGEWRWVIEIDGPQGRGLGVSEPFEVLDPPGFPIWLGWLIGLFPLYGLIWFGIREGRRTRAQIAQDGGARC